MTKLIKTITSFLIFFFLLSDVYAANEKLNISREDARLDVVKDTAGMDALIESLQGQHVVKTGFSSRPIRIHASGASDFSGNSIKASSGRFEDTTVIDLYTAITGLVLVGVIALRRMS